LRSGSHNAGSGRYAVSTIDLVVLDVVATSDVQSAKAAEVENQALIGPRGRDDNRSPHF